MDGGAVLAAPGRSAACAETDANNAIDATPNIALRHMTTSNAYSNFTLGQF
jgi:hypothetical protein